MPIIILVILIVLWFFGLFQVPGLLIPNLTLFIINGQPITLISLIIFILILSLISLLPPIMRWVLGIVLLVWVLSILGLLFIPGLSSLLLIAIIIGGLLALALSS